MSVSPLPQSVLLAGCGDLGCRLGRLLLAEGCEVLGVRRDPSRLPEGFEGLQEDLAGRGGLRSLPTQVGATVFLVSPDRFEDRAYRRAFVDAPARVLRVVSDPGRVIFVSSTSVLAQDDGSWVDEDSPVLERGFSRRHLLHGERLAREAGGLALRLAGLYGPGRTRLLDSVRQGIASYRDGEDEWTNRIHVDDAAEALLALLRHPVPEPLYLGVDDEPARRRDVLGWLAERLGADPPEAASGRESAGRRPRSSKRCSNRRLRAAGWRPRYPSYREGYSALLGSTD